jgi:glutathione synthase/RimK-type ligase-like ATP-grasp enzyme
MRPGDIPAMFDRLQTARLIVKPVVSTNATDTFLLESGSYDESALLRTFGKRAFVAQPFIENICSEGEYSLVYFSGTYSHAIRKVPKDRDFRVQEEHGADIRTAEPEPALIDCADRVLRLVEPLPVYARGDFVRGPDGHFLLMELELIEPSMYLRMHADAPRRFAEAFDRYVSSVGESGRGAFARGGDL